MRRTPIDFLAADGHKWLLGPEGAGFLFVRRDWIDRLRPIGVGWHSVVGSYNAPVPEFRLKPTAQRWEGGSFNMPGLLTFGASLDLFFEWGLDAVARRIADRADGVRELALSAGWTVVRLDRGRRTARRSSCSSATASSPRRSPPNCGPPRGRGGLPAGAAPHQPPRLQ